MRLSPSFSFSPFFSPYFFFSFFCIDTQTEKTLLLPGKTHLGPDMFKIDSQFLQQWWLPFIPLRPKRSEPSSPQSSLLAHPPTHASGRRPEPAIYTARADRVCGHRLAGGHAVAAIGSLRGCRVARHRGVGRRIKLEVLRRRLGAVGRLLRVKLGHGGRWCGTVRRRREEAVTARRAGYAEGAKADKQPRRVPVAVEEACGWLLKISRWGVRGCTSEVDAVY